MGGLGARREQIALVIAPGERLAPAIVEDLREHGLSVELIAADTAAAAIERSPDLIVVGGAAVHDAKLLEGLARRASRARVVVIVGEDGALARESQAFATVRRTASSHALAERIVRAAAALDRAFGAGRDARVSRRASRLDPALDEDPPTARYGREQMEQLRRSMRRIHDGPTLDGVPTDADGAAAQGGGDDAGHADAQHEAPARDRLAREPNEAQRVAAPALDRDSGAARDAAPSLHDPIEIAIDLAEELDDAAPPIQPSPVRTEARTPPLRQHGARTRHRVLLATCIGAAALALPSVWALVTRDTPSHPASQRARRAPARTDDDALPSSPVIPTFDRAAVEPVEITTVGPGPDEPLEGDATELDLALFGDETDEPRARAAPAELLRHANAARIEGRFEDARRQYRALLAIDPDQPRALAGLARLYLDQGDAGRAVLAAQHLVRLRAYPNHYILLGDALLAGRNREGARRAYERALELNPRAARARERLTQIDAVD